MNYTIDLDNDIEQIEDYEEKDNNILEVQVFDKNTGKRIENCYPIMFLSKDGMLGLGKELIRYAKNDFHNMKHEHLDPCVHEDESGVRLGVWVTPKSSPLIICCTDDFGTVDEVIRSNFKK